MFRGPEHSGVADHEQIPADWNVATGKNIRWKTPIPGLAHSSPIVWGESIFVTTAVSENPNPQLKIGLYGDGDSADDNVPHQWKIYCIDKRTGKIRWERTCTSGKPKAPRHTKATQCNTTPVTDGKRVVAFFGSEGMFCYDIKGK